MSPFVSRRRSICLLFLDLMSPFHSRQILYQWLIKLGKKYPNWRVGKDEFDYSVRLFSFLALLPDLLPS